MDFSHRHRSQTVSVSHPAFYPRVWVVLQYDDGKGETDKTKGSALSIITQMKL
jgi:hypothetical protein